MFVNVIPLVASRHFAHMQHLRVISIAITMHPRFLIFLIVVHQPSNFACAICVCQFHTVKELLSHLKEHLVEGRPVACPVTGCKSTLNLVILYCTHVQHRPCSAGNISDIYKEVTPQSAFHDVSHNLGPDEFLRT